MKPAGYATAFYGKSHLGDVESSYLNKQGLRRSTLDAVQSGSKSLHSASCAEERR